MTGKKFERTSFSGVRSNLSVSAILGSAVLAVGTAGVHLIVDPLVFQIGGGRHVIGDLQGVARLGDLLADFSILFRHIASLRT